MTGHNPISANDLYLGHEGADTFVVGLNHGAEDTIGDFTDGEDVIDLTAFTSIAGVRSRNCCDVSANGCDVVALRCVAAAGGTGLWLHRDPDWDSRSTCSARLRSSPAGSGSAHPSRLRRRIKLGHC